MADEQFVVELKIDLNAKDLRAELSTALGGLNESVTGFDKKIGGVQKSLDGATKSQQSFHQSLSTTRYALYDVSSTLGIAGAAMLGLATATTAVAIAWERDFANVVRTSGAVGKEVGVLREQFVGLAQALPASFGDIAKIGTLGSQLGIGQKSLAAFTETVIKFSAATGISAEESAQAFGRLGNILGVSANEYDNLGSSIVKAGLSAVATESEIVAVAQQIGPIARLAGASANEVIGLATAFASVKIPPELARSVVTKTFGDITRAVATGSEKLTEFGKVTGQSAQQFAQSWNSDATGTFVNLLQALPKDASGATLALDALGLSSQRNTPALLKLAQNTDLVRKSLREAETGFAENTELSRQFGIIAETTAAKLQVFANNFQALLDAIGSANLGPINAILDALSGFLGMLTDIVSTDIGGRIAGIAVAFTAIAGVLVIAAGGMALFAASSIGMQQALLGIIATAPVAAARILGTGTAAALASGEMNAAAVGARGLLLALKALGVITLVLAVPDIAKSLNEQVDKIKGFGNEIEDIQKRISSKGVFFDSSALDEAIKNADGSFNNFVQDINRNSANIGFGTAAVSEIKKFDDALAASASAGNIDTVKQKIIELGIPMDRLKGVLPETADALDKFGGDAEKAANTGVEELNQAMQETQQDAQEAQDAIDALKDAVLNFGNTSISVEESQIKLSGAFNAMTEAAADADASLTGTNGASLELRQSYIDIDKAARDAAIAIIENKGSVEEATAKYNESREAIIQSRIAKGEDETAARAWADKVLGSAADAEGAIRNYAGSYNAVPKDVYTAIHVTGASAAYDEIMSVQRYLNTLPGVKNVRIAVGAGGQGGITFATGGPVYGPGSGTSDSINARLSNGEYVIRAAAVKQFGVGYFNALNQGRKPRGFASGGAVNAAPSAPSMMGGVVELGPRSMARLTQSVINNINIDDVAISRASQSGDAKRRSTGDL